MQDTVMRKERKFPGWGHTMIITVTIIAFFVCIILTYYFMMYRERRTRIIQSGEMTAIRSADRIEKYLSTNIDCINLSAYILDEMISEGKGNDEILDYMVSESTAIKSAVLENSTGLYGYINDEFMSGTLWEPYEGYVATERPWYTKPMANKGVLTMLEPYLDVQSGNIMLAAGKTLCDGESVISVDISLDRIQSITEEAVKSGSSDILMIINSEGTVIAHSDRQEVEKRYTREGYTLGDAIFRTIEKTDEPAFDLRYDGFHYIVYSTPIGNDWKCISVINATSSFRFLNFILAVTIILVVSTITIISAIMIKSQRRQDLASRLSSQLSSTADIYVSLHEIDIPSDTFTEIRNIREEASEMIRKNTSHAQKTIREVMYRFSDPSTRDRLMDFVDFGTIDERLRDTNTATCEFLSDDGLWRRARYIVSKRNSSGKVVRMMYLIENIDAEKRERDNFLSSVKLMGEKIETLTEVASLDDLTGFLNKSKGPERIEEICKTSEGSLILFDLDNFKLINDLYGHDMGDKVLKVFADIVRANTDGDDILCRIGGDEFMMFSQHIRDERAISDFTDILNRQLIAECRKLIGDSFDLPIGISLGAAFAPVHSNEYARLFRYADASMYRVKQNGKHGYSIYDPEVSDEDEKEDLDSELIKLTQIMEERGTAGGALLLGQEAFTVNYRYIMRYIRRYGKKADKAVISIVLKDNSYDIHAVASEFATLLQKMLRNSDIIYQNRPDEFFLLLPEMGYSISDVMDRIIRAWNETEYKEVAEIRYISSTT